MMPDKKVGKIDVLLPPALTAETVELGPRIASTSGPDFEALVKYFHGATPDGYVSFAAGKDEGFHDIGAVPVRELREAISGEASVPWLPTLFDALVLDGLFTISAQFRAGVRVRTRHRYINADIEGQLCQVETPYTDVDRYVPGGDGLHYAHRAIDSVRWLTACFTDVDGYRADEPTDGPGSVANILRAHRAGLIPTPSFLMASGRGAWCFWQLVDQRNPPPGEQLLLHGIRHEADTPVRASTYAVRMHRRLCETLTARLASIGGDMSSVDAARLCRVPGSRNSDADDAIVEILPVLVRSVMRVYTMEELEDWLQLPRLERGRPPLAIGARRLSEAEYQQRVDAMRARHRRVYDALTKLSAVRGGFWPGTRNLALFHVGLAGVFAGLSDAEVGGAVHVLARACRPDTDGHRVSEADVRGVLRSVARARKRPRLPPRYSTLARALAITQAERAAIGLLLRKPPVAEGQTGARDRAILDYLTTHKRTKTQAPPTREMARILTAGGLPVTHNAVAEAYRRLGVRSGRPPAVLPADLFGPTSPGAPPPERDTYDVPLYRERAPRRKPGQ